MRSNEFELWSVVIKVKCCEGIFVGVGFIGIYVKCKSYYFGYFEVFFRL